MHSQKRTSSIHGREGFTLIELLVVIAIIGLLASVVMASLNSVRAKGRDANRAASVREVQKALELYYDTNGRYPTSADEPFTGAWTAALVPSYLPAMPVDPSFPSREYRSYTASQNPAPFYAIRVSYETKPTCYVCAGTPCGPNIGWWGVNICQ